MFDESVKTRGFVIPTKEGSGFQNTGQKTFPITSN